MSTVTKEKPRSCLASSGFGSRIRHVVLSFGPRITPILFGACIDMRVEHNAPQHGLCTKIFGGYPPVWINHSHPPKPSSSIIVFVDIISQSTCALTPDLTPNVTICFSNIISQNPDHLAMRTPRPPRKYHPP